MESKQFDGAKEVDGAELADAQLEQVAVGAGSPAPAHICPICGGVEEWSQLAMDFYCPKCQPEAFPGRG